MLSFFCHILAKLKTNKGIYTLDKTILNKDLGYTTIQHKNKTSYKFRIISDYRVVVMIATCIAILAVDF